MNEYRLEHFGLIVSNIEKSAEFYKKNFGFSEVKQFEKPDLEIRGLIMKLGNFAIELLQPYSETDSKECIKENIEGKRSPKGLFKKIASGHIALSVPDINSAYQNLKENNADILTEIIEYRYFFCRDLDNILLEIRQRK
ncbi:MAG: VOC family protein [archaeon]